MNKRLKKANLSLETKREDRGFSLLAKFFVVVLSSLSIFYLYILTRQKKSTHGINEFISLDEDPLPAECQNLYADAFDKKIGVLGEKNSAILSAAKKETYAVLCEVYKGKLPPCSDNLNILFDTESVGNIHQAGAEVHTSYDNDNTLDATLKLNSYIMATEGVIDTLTTVRHELEHFGNACAQQKNKLKIKEFELDRINKFKNLIRLNAPYKTDDQAKEFKESLAKDLTALQPALDAYSKGLKNLTPKLITQAKSLANNRFTTFTFDDNTRIDAIFLFAQALQSKKFEKCKVVDSTPSKTVVQLKDVDGFVNHLNTILSDSFKDKMVMTKRNRLTRKSIDEIKELGLEQELVDVAYHAELVPRLIELNEEVLRLLFPNVLKYREKYYNYFGIEPPTLDYKRELVC